MIPIIPLSFTPLIIQSPPVFLGSEHAKSHSAPGSLHWCLSLPEYPFPHYSTDIPVTSNFTSFKSFSNFTFSTKTTTITLFKILHHFTVPVLLLCSISTSVAFTCQYTVWFTYLLYYFYHLLPLIKIYTPKGQWWFVYIIFLIYPKNQGKSLAYSSSQSI